MKLYIPFNMVVDTDFGIIRIIEKLYKIPEYPVDKIKSFLLKREIENPVYEYCELRNIEYDQYLYEEIIEKHYDTVLKLSCLTDILSFIINTYKLGLSNEVEITVGCNYDSEIKFLKQILSASKYSVNSKLNTDIKLNDFDYIFTRCLDEFYVEYLIDNGINGKRLYVADYRFNTIIDEESKSVIINPLLHIKLESEGIIVSTISIYNKK